MATAAISFEERDIKIGGGQETRIVKIAQRHQLATQANYRTEDPCFRQVKQRKNGGGMVEPTIAKGEKNGPFAFPNRYSYFLLRLRE